MEFSYIFAYTCTFSFWVFINQVVFNGVKKGRSILSQNLDYSKEEWLDIMLLAGLAMATKVVEGTNRFSIFPGRLFGLIKEAVTYNELLDKVSKKYPDNELISEVVSSLKKPSHSQSNKVLKKVQEIEPLVDRVNVALAEKSDEKEAGEYRAFAYEVAYEVCKSAGGGFLGIKENIDAKEAEFLQKLKSALLD
jgi:hypothetical protein